ncbi:hypothetical protein [Lysobacter capsici]|uniref:hypothetical protein n=1 Tax=Lysobacter capsici TaxID=435897 RepID=UPI0012FD8211|nr:hypothetical protein [Lysobacter capsici]
MQRATAAVAETTATTRATTRATSSEAVEGIGVERLAPMPGGRICRCDRAGMKCGKRSLTSTVIEVRGRLGGLHRETRMRSPRESSAPRLDNGVASIARHAAFRSSSSQFAFGWPKSRKAMNACDESNLGKPETHREEDRSNVVDQLHKF